jgi:GntR family transcriptional regulator, transcriptional repressor for pyruvate dehydrogenase complex
MALKAVKKKRVHEEISEQISRQLAAGQWKPGDRLPSERELSARFQVSRASVREAMRALESLGVVQILIGQGTFIASGSATLLSPFISAALKRRELLRDIFEARKVLEPEIAALAAQRASASQIRKMRGILAEQAHQIRQGLSGVEADTAFHSLLTQSMKNKVFIRLSAAFVDSLRDTRELSLQVDGRPARSLAGHWEILEAIQSRDPGRARRAMLRHLAAIERNVLKSANKGKGGRRGRSLGEPTMCVA